MLSVNHFSTYSHGGAAMAARRIADGFAESEVRNQFFFQGSEDQDQWKKIRFDEPKPTFWYRKFRAKRVLRDFQAADRQFQQHLAIRGDDLPTFSPGRSYWTTFANRSILDADIMHLHWVAFLFDYPTFFQSIGSNQPIVWTLHDMNPLTGGCHYSGSCQRFEQGCGNCPQLQTAGEGDISEFSFRHKQSALKKRSMDVVAPSRWLLELARKSPIFPRSTRWHHINYGIDTAAFAPSDKSRSKHQLGLDPQLPLLLFAAQDLSDPRKGFKELCQALGQIPTDMNFQIAVFGNGDCSAIKSNQEIVSLGYLETNQQKQTAYDAADLFLLPSLQDNQPQTGLEALACGTPVVAFRAGGIPEFVVHDKTGMTADVGNVQQLACLITDLLDDNVKRDRLGKAARALIIREFESVQQTDCYLKIYRSALGRSRPFWRPAKVA